MATSSTRQRKLARAKLDRQMVRRAERERRGRQLKAIIGGGLAIAVIGLGAAWKFGAFDSAPAAPEAAPDCTWNPQETSGNADLVEVGTPPATGIAKAGQAAMTVAFKTGNVTVDLERATAPCAAASLAFLADKGFYNNTNCHSLTHADGEFALHCGDKSGTGQGGAAYTWYPENIPSEPLIDPSAAASASPGASPSTAPSAAPKVNYPRGTVAMIPSLNGSQFVIFYKDSTLSTPNLDIVGRVSSGIEVIEAIAKAGTVANSAGVDTKPKSDVTISTLTVVDKTPPVESTPSAAPSTAPSAAPATSAKPTPSVKASAS